MTQPTIVQVGQYLKDLSFENFAATMPMTGMPGAEMNVNVEIKQLKEPQISEGKVTGDYEVILFIRATARPIKDGAPDMDKTIFIIETSYAGRYQFNNVPQQEVEPFLSIEAPRLLFPFVRQIAADAVMQGGLPPFLMAPIDFVQIYQQRQAQSQANH